MIHYAWLFAAFYCGLFLGILILGLCSANSSADRTQRQMKDQIKKEGFTC